MEQNGIFINYQMAEAINVIGTFDLNTNEGKERALIALQELKGKWLNRDTFPGTKIKIGDRFAGMQDITLEEVVQLSTLVKQVETYTVENAGAFQNILVIDDNGNYSFEFEKLDEIARLAINNNKKLIIDSAVVFGDHFPTKIANLDEETISMMIGEYTRQLTSRYDGLIDRIDVLNSIFQRKQLSPKNEAEDFWNRKFENDYARKIVDIVRRNIVSNNKIKLCWNEFYLTNSNYSQRKNDFLSAIGSINGLDVIGIQDRFRSGESTDYIIKSLDDISAVSRQSNKEMCITEFSCSVSSDDLTNENTQTVNSKIQHVLGTVKKYCSTNPTIKRIEGRVSDKFDFNHKELRDNGYDISTTGRKSIINGEQTQVKKPEKHFYRMSQSEFKIYQQLKMKNQAIKQTKTQINQIDKPKIKKLTPPSSNNGGSQNSNNGFTNVILLSVIVSIICSILFMLVYMFVGR